MCFVGFVSECVFHRLIEVFVCVPFSVPFTPFSPPPPILIDGCLSVYMECSHNCAYASSIFIFPFSLSVSTKYFKSIAHEDMRERNTSLFVVIVFILFFFHLMKL